MERPAVLIGQQGRFVYISRVERVAGEIGKEAKKTVGNSICVWMYILGWCTNLFIIFLCWGELTRRKEWGGRRFTTSTVHASSFIYQHDLSKKCGSTLDIGLAVQMGEQGRLYISSSEWVVRRKPQGNAYIRGEEQEGI